MSPVAAANRLAALEDRLLTETGQQFTLTGKALEARRRTTQAVEWVRLAVEDAEGDQARELLLALKNLRRALAGIEAAQ